MKRLFLGLILTGFISINLAEAKASNYQKKFSEKELKAKLTPLQYKVTREDGTEPPFKNKYWDNKRDGLYVDIISGEPLFSSTHKYKSGTGWPSFFKPLNQKFVKLKADNSLFTKRTEVRSVYSDSHLGHVFDDGPEPTKKRYCINSASLRFVPLAELEKKGYGQYKVLFEKKILKNKNSLAIATFAGGCFWCMEPPFDKLKGVKKTTSGYAGGKKKNPNYKEVAGGLTKHRESVQVEYDPKQVSFEKLVEVFWKSVNPTDNDGQFVDRGFQYSSAIFVNNDEERKIAEKSKKDLIAKKLFKKPVITPIVDFSTFYSAEEYHQDYYKKNPVRYKYYRYRSGRDQFLKKIWDK